MSAFKRYNEDFKQSLVNLYQIGKTQTELWRDYGVSSSALTKWIKPYSEVKLEDNTFMTAKQSPRLKKSFHPDNLLKQQLNPEKPNQVWTTDFTYIPIGHN